MPLGLARSSSSISFTSFLGRHRRTFLAGIVVFALFNSAKKLALSIASTLMDEDGCCGGLGSVSSELRLSAGRLEETAKERGGGI